MLEYTEGEQPWARSNPGQLRCPYCGGKNVINAYDDIADDELRMEFYCDNSDCEVRTFTIIPLRTNGPVAWKRADVAALEAVDRGIGDEQLPEIIDLFKDWGKVEEHTAGILPRRRRSTEVILKVREEAVSD
jgi:hypothetical protein